MSAPNDTLFDLDAVACALSLAHIVHYYCRHEKEHNLSIGVLHSDHSLPAESIPDYSRYQPRTLLASPGLRT